MRLSAPPEAIYAVEQFHKGRAEHSSTEAEGFELGRDRARILVVDDQKLIADSLAEILRNEGFDAVAAYDGWQALKAVPGFRPNWLLSDVLMPRMNGVQLAISIRKNFPKIGILLLSGQAGIAEILQEGLRHGYQFELIAKPIHPLHIVERLKRER